MSSYMQYGGLVHAADECTLAGVEKRTRYGERNRRLSRTETWHIHGELMYPTSAELITAAQNVINAYAQDGQVATFTVGGTIAHRLNSDSSSGVRVMMTSFPRGDAAELATVRTFSVVLQATYDAPEDDLVSWSESVSTEGTGGPMIVIVTEGEGIQFSGGVYAVQVAPRTPQWYTQTGTAVGYTTYPQPPGPVNPEGELQHMRRITYTSGRQMGNGIRYFTTRWYYRMARDLAVFGVVDYKPTSK